jgi:hypothetical protein
MIIGQSIDFNKNDTSKFRIENLISAPTVVTADKGYLYFNTASSKFFGWNGTAWVDLGASGGGGGATTFLALTDTPSAYTGLAFQFLRVNAGETAAEFAPVPIKAEDQGNGIGYALADRDETKFSILGARAFDLTFYDGGVRTDYGVGCDSGFSHGSENRLPLIGGEYGGHVAFGGANYIAGYYGNIAMGNANTLNTGYTCMQVGYKNIGNWNNSVGMGYQFGTNNTSSAYFNQSVGSGLTNNWVGATMVGSSNLIDAAGATAANRPMFTVGIGTLSTGGGSVGAPITRRDGFMVRANGEVTLPYTTIAIIDAEATGKQAITKEWIIAQGFATALPYKVYTCEISQLGTSAPTATVYENTLGGTVVWTRSATGTYIGTLTGAFTTKTIGFANIGKANLGNQYDIYWESNTVNTFVIQTRENGTRADSVLVEASLEIRVYV